MNDTIHCLYLSEQEKEILHDVLTYFVDNGKPVVVPPNSLNERRLIDVLWRLRHGNKLRPRAVMGERGIVVYSDGVRFIELTEPSDVEAAWQEFNRKT